MMTVQVQYFARFRERLGLAEETVSLTPETVRLQALRQSLAARGGVWAEVLGPGSPLMIAVNQALYPCSQDLDLEPGDEIAFFPPVTGG